ncbi:hypothetical protein ACFLZY_02200, partial [Patescibacteria group bacterium]
NDVVVLTLGPDENPDNPYTIYVFDPVEYLGNESEDTNYTITLTTDLRKLDDSPAFADGKPYEWFFEVSTEIDLNPPEVVSVIPRAEDTYARNISVEISFNEAMNPLAVSGTYDPLTGGIDFTNIVVLETDTTDEQNVTGTFNISNGYKTVDFTTQDPCGQDPCGDTIYCLPYNPAGSASTAGIRVEAHAAPLSNEPPQAALTGALYAGVVDAASNSLNGNGNVHPETGLDWAEGPPDDDFVWNFRINNKIDDHVPEIVSTLPSILQGKVGHDLDVEIVFDVLMKASTLNTSAMQLIPNPVYELWFKTGKRDTETQTTAMIQHPTLITEGDGGWDYYNVITNDVKSAYQICMHPSVGPTNNSLDADGKCNVTIAQPYCCNGQPSVYACSPPFAGQRK